MKIKEKIERHWQGLGFKQLSVYAFVLEDKENFKAQIVSVSKQDFNKYGKGKEYNLNKI